MTQDQENTAEEIIQLHKEKDGTVTSDQLHKFIGFEKSNQSIIIMTALEELGIIEYMGSHRYRSRLTEYGWRFPGFTENRQSEKESFDKDNLIKELTIKQLKGNIFQLKYWWLLLLISGLIGFISGNFELIQEWLTIILE